MAARCHPHTLTHGPPNNPPSSPPPPMAPPTILPPHRVQLCGVGACVGSCRLPRPPGVAGVKGQGGGGRRSRQRRAVQHHPAGRLSLHRGEESGACYVCVWRGGGGRPTGKRQRQRQQARHTRATAASHPPRSPLPPLHAQPTHPPGHSAAPHPCTAPAPRQRGRQPGAGRLHTRGGWVGDEQEQGCTQNAGEGTALPPPPPPPASPPSRWQQQPPCSPVGRC